MDNKQERYALIGVIISTLGAIITGLIQKGDITYFLIFISALIVLSAIYAILLISRRCKYSEHYKLKHHRFFSKMRFWINIYIPTLDLKIDNKRKEKMIKDFLMIKFKVFEAGILKYLCDTDNYAVCSKFEKIIYELMNDYEAQAVKAGIPKIFVDKFRDWHQPATSFIIEFTREICGADYITCREKMRSILDILCAAFSLTLIDAVKTLRSLNGEIDAELNKE